MSNNGPSRKPLGKIDAQSLIPEPAGFERSAYAVTKISYSPTKRKVSPVKHNFSPKKRYSPTKSRFSPKKRGSPPKLKTPERGRIKDLRKDNYEELPLPLRHYIENTYFPSRVPTTLAALDFRTKVLAKRPTPSRKKLLDEISHFVGSHPPHPYTYKELYKALEAHPPATPLFQVKRESKLNKTEHHDFQSTKAINTNTYKGF